MHQYRANSRSYVIAATVATVLLILVILAKHHHQDRQTTDQKTTIQLVKDLQKQINEQKEVIQEQKKENAEFVEKISWFGHLNVTPSVNGKKIITHRHPDVIIGGAKRCGVAVLKMFMEAHPRVRFRYADGHFFDRVSPKKRRKWIYRFMMPMSQTSDITAEKTPNYMGVPVVPQRIYDMFPKIQLIFILCEPGQRTFSDYKYLMRTKIQTNPDRQKHQELLNLKTFNASANYYMDMISKAQANGTLEELINHKYRSDSGFEVFSNSLYTQHLQRWLDIFPRKQILFIDGKTLVSNPEREMTRVQDFLEVSHALTSRNFIKDEFEDQYYCVKKNAYLTCTPSNKRTNWNPSDDDDTINTIKRLNDFYKKVNNYNSSLNDVIGQSFVWSS